MPYTEPSFVKEGVVERLIEENTGSVSMQKINPKKRSRQEFEARKPLLSVGDQLENKAASPASKFNKSLLVKAVSTQSLN